MSMVTIDIERAATADVVVALRREAERHKKAAAKFAGREDRRGERARRKHYMACRNLNDTSRRITTALAEGLGL